MLQKEDILLIIYFVVITFVLVGFVVIFFVAFQKRKNKFLLERLEAEKRLEQELTNAQLEIQEQTLKNIAWELHDNVGQLLSVASMQLNLLAAKEDLKNLNDINEVKELITASVNEIRNLSKILNSDVIGNNGLLESLKTELERLNRLNFLTASLEIKGEVIPISDSNEILIFRILQECISNVIKHSKANNLLVHLDYNIDYLNITLKDNGEGFDTSANSGNSGMQTMKARAELLKADFELQSEIGKGTTLLLRYPI